MHSGRMANGCWAIKSLTALAFGEDIFEKKKGRGYLALLCCLLGKRDKRVAFFASAELDGRGQRGSVKH